MNSQDFVEISSNLFASRLRISELERRIGTPESNSERRVVVLDFITDSSVVSTCPNLSSNIGSRESCLVAYHQIRIEGSDVLTYLPEATEFIDHYIADNSVCLLSSIGQEWIITTVALCYLIRQSGLGYTDEYESKLRGKRFLDSYHEEQVSLWENMGYVIEPSDPAYQDFIVKITAANNETDVLNRNFSGVGGKDVFKCGKCGKYLWAKRNMYSHMKGAGQEAFSWQKQSQDNSATLCTSFFLKPMKWMNLQYGVMQGKLFCPKCNDRLGTFKWCGLRCSCGTFVAPGFQVHEKKIR